MCNTKKYLLLLVVLILLSTITELIIKASISEIEMTGFPFKVQELLYSPQD
jgi:hypothetical protein